jgi:Transglutaminase-like superfamily
MFSTSVWAALAWGACAAPPAPLVSSSPPPAAPAALPPDATRHYAIWLGGGRVGTATEIETWTRTGMHLQRDEHMTFLRADSQVELVTTIDIDADSQLRAQRVRWTERSGASWKRAEALRTPADNAWHASDPSIAIAAGATPAELAPLIVRRDGKFAGPVVLAARGFVSGNGRIDPVAPGRLIARLDLPGPTVAEATIDQAADGMPARVVDGDGVIAIRVTEAQARAPFEAIDLVDATAVPIAGTRSAHAALVLDGELALPPVPGQAATTSAHGVAVLLGAELPGGLPALDDNGGDRSGEIRDLVDDVRSRVTPDLGAPTASPRDADAATAGDCTTFALAYAALATRRGIATRLVTGLRVDGDRLVRHRWATSWTGRAWIAVDAAFDAAPAGGDLVGLAVGDPDDAGLVAGDAALARVRGARWR